VVLTRRLATGALLVTSLAVTTAACGPSHSAALETVKLDPKAVVDPLAAQTSEWILQHAAAGTVSARAVHVTGTSKDSGHTVTFNLSVAGTHGCTGTMKESDAGSFQLISNGTTVWIKPDDEFWRTVAGVTDQATLDKVEGKYLEGSASSSDFSALARLCKMKTLLSTFSKAPDGGTKGETRGPITMVNGQRVVKISDTADSAYVYATDTAQPKMVQVVDPASGGERFTFDYPGTAITINPPPDDLILTQ
jgi:hypothetical protein